MSASPALQATSSTPNGPPTGVPTRSESHDSATTNRITTAAQQSSTAPSTPAVEGSQPESQAPSGPSASQPSARPQTTVAPIASNRSTPTSTQTNGAGQSITETEEYKALSRMISTSSPEVVRQAVRGHAKLCLLGSEFHLGFILNTAISVANDGQLKGAVKGFGSRLAQTTKQDWVSHLKTSDVDEIADVLIQRASNQFLDRAMARRLETISGQELVNALARSERLGYDVRDIVAGEPADRGEQVIPSMHGAHVVSRPHTTSAMPPPRPNPVQQAPAPHHAPLPPAQPPMKIIHWTSCLPSNFTAPRGGLHLLNEIKPCQRCGRPCSSEEALKQHLKKGPCTPYPVAFQRIGQDVCLHCGCAFTSQGGLSYHTKSAVCGNHSEAMMQLMKSVLRFMSEKHPPKASQARAPQPPSTPNNGYNSHAQHPGMAAPPGASHMGRMVDPNADAYTSMSPQARSAFDQEMQAAEDHYGGRMKEALRLPEAEAQTEISKLKNSLNSKQSTLRKKYGIKLRVRRTRAEIEADEERLLAGSPARTPPAGPGNASAAGAMAGVKRPSSSQGDTPRKRVPLDQMGGLTGSSASAEMTDPTLIMNSSQPRAGQQAPPSNQNGPAPSQALPMQQPLGRASLGGTRDDPMEVDSEGENVPTTGNLEVNGQNAPPFTKTN